MNRRQAAVWRKKQQLDAVKLRTNIGCVQKAARGIKIELELTLLPQFKTFKCVRRIKMAAKGGGVTAEKPTVGFNEGTLTSSVV